MKIQSPTPQRFWTSAGHLGLTAHCVFSTCSFLHRVPGILLTALHFQSCPCSLPCWPACHKGEGQGYLFCLKYMVRKWESRSVVQWEAPWIGVSSCASHSVPGTQPAQANPVPRAPASLPAVLEAHSGLKPVSALTHLSLILFRFLAWVMQCTTFPFEYRPTENETRKGLMGMELKLRRSKVHSHLSPGSSVWSWAWILS